MGLDSHYLLLDFENFFGIHVPGLEAEKILSVQDMVDCVAKHLEVSSHETTLKLEVFEKLRSVLMQLKIEDSSLSLSNSAFSIIHPDNKEMWASLNNQLSLEIPHPITESKTVIGKLFSKIWSTGYDWKTITIDQFVTAICATNYKQLVNPKAIKNTYDILVAVIGITSDSQGIDVYEIQPNNRFVDDLGIQ